ncbi:uncharacterized protein Ecym_1023 [Eremothecium cymbalariae DBVPG|uniref:Uncharacterized protein n=1 Tax=Eremothecium cymbalariae (strain CBS 270.75 / DBVPG 7215 / KCTC 17166 / NRRL Y-17582) TaxID=931890 RepID=G8JM22_ERECY|nr:hypothetical protein Ecym_1023 [Eremothecium cymbalariae DBVPG\
MGGIPDNLADLIHKKYQDALTNKHIVFRKSSSKKLKSADSRVEYLITYMPNSQDKPERNDLLLKNFDPFEKPDEPLTVLNSVNKDYTLLLNKYPVIPEHILLVTKKFEDQRSPLSPDDLLTAYQLLDKLDDEDDDKRYVAFYNCGPNSGSSVDHKHLQLFKLPDNVTLFQDKLCKGENHFLPGSNMEPLQERNVSFCHFVIPLPDEMEKVTKDLLAMTFIALLQRVLTLFQNWENDKIDLTISYNVMITKKWMCVVPRSKAVGETTPLGLNAIGYMGLLLVRAEDILNQLLESPHLMDQLLLECGFPNNAGFKSNEYSY